MEDLLTATLALDTTVTTQVTMKSQTSTTRLKPQPSEENQLSEPQLMQEKWKFTVAFLILGIS